MPNCPSNATRALLAPAWMLAAAGLVGLGMRLGGSAGHADGMPPAMATAEQRRIYSTPAGLYRRADIRANGAAPASEKYRGQMPHHDMHPRPGDVICPITATKADPRFAWTVEGKQYLFCCPACIDEFVQRARTNSTSIRPPEGYIER